MRISQIKIKLLAGLFALLVSNLAFAEDYTLTVVLKDVKNSKGDVYVELYSDPATFRKSAKALAISKAPANAGRVSVKFDGLKIGHYALLAFHDEDGNGILNKRFGMIPTEGYGLSNDPKVIGPPSFEDSDFEILGDGSITLAMKY